MDRANKAMRQKFKRVQQNLGLSEKRDELQAVQDVDQRNQRIIASVATYRKNIASCIKTGVKEDQMEKRKKKLDEFPLVIDLAADAKDLETTKSTCLSKVMRHISVAVNKVLDERIHVEQTVEKRVLDQLSKYLEMDKSLSKCKEKLNNMIIDVDIARKALNSKHEDSRAQELQDEVDTHSLKLDSHKDATITDIYTLASKEQEIATIFASYVEEQIEYHRSALLAYENALPEILRDIATAQPRPVFGVDLEEHLRHTGRRISLVLEKCCEMLRRTGFNEKGLFRVNGNNTKIKRMKAAFDCGQIDDFAEENEYMTDPHSICSVLKCYLRELPEPLLTNHLHSEWAAAVRLEGTSRINEVQRILQELPIANRDNLMYLVQFLTLMMQYDHITMMNAGNLSIVFGPNLVGGSSVENDNVTGSRVVETLLLNSNQFFGFSPLPSTTVVQQQSTTATGSTTSFSSGGSDSSLLNRSLSSPAQNNHTLSVDTQNARNRLDISAISPAFSQHSVSPSPGRARPKQPAPLPPNQTSCVMSQSATSLNSIRSDVAQAVALPPKSNNNHKMFEPTNLETITATFSQPMYAPSPVINDLYTTSTHAVPIDRGGDRALDLSALEQLERDMVCSTSKSPSQTSQDSMNDYANDAMSRSLSEIKPNRPPPPVVRTNSNASQSVRPISYNAAVQNAPQPAQRQRMFPTMSAFAESDVSSTVVQQHRPPIVHDSENRTLITVETPERVNRSTVETPDRMNRGMKPPLPTKPKSEEITKL